MHESSASGPSIREASLNAGRSRSRPDALSGARRGNAVALVALARLERDHVALLAALCDLETVGGARKRGTQHLSAAMRDALAVLLRADLKQTQRALALAAEGCYGMCEDCDTPLASVVLLTTPATTHCPSCAGDIARARQLH